MPDQAFDDGFIERIKGSDETLQAFNVDTDALHQHRIKQSAAIAIRQIDRLAHHPRFCRDMFHRDIQRTMIFNAVERGIEDFGAAGIIALQRRQRLGYW